MTTELPLLIEPADLADHLAAPDLLIIDLCKDQVYDQAHVPGASFRLSRRRVASASASRDVDVDVGGWGW